jgi:dihydroxyacid dehydratase/phosphogluconate dehydratase
MSIMLSLSLYIDSFVPTSRNLPHTTRKTRTLICIAYRSHGFCIGHVVPEAQVGGPIALVRDGDIISVDAVKNTLELQVSPQELEQRRNEWKAPPLKVNQGTLYKYTKVVTDASHGCVTDA